MERQDNELQKLEKEQVDQMVEMYQYGYELGEMADILELDDEIVEKALVKRLN